MQLNYTNFFYAVKFGARLCTDIFPELPKELQTPELKSALDANVALVARLKESFEKTQQVEPDFYQTILAGFKNAITVYTSILPADQKNTWQLLPTLVRNVSDLSTWVEDWTTTVEYDRRNVELAKANPGVSDTWLALSLSTLGGDLVNLHGKKHEESLLTEAQADEEAALDEAQKELPNASETNIVRAEIGGIYSQLIDVLIDQNRWDDAAAELDKLVAFADDCTANDYLSPLMNWEYYLKALKIADHFVPTDSFDDQFDKAVALGQKAVGILKRLIDAQPNFEPGCLRQIFFLAGGRIDLAKLPLNELPKRPGIDDAKGGNDKTGDGAAAKPATAPTAAA
jgi:tetratricopeptide (TPR) repeat protein